MDFQSMLKQLGQKIKDVQELKMNISKEFQFANSRKQLGNLIKQQIRPSIIQQLNKYYQYQTNAVCVLQRNYQEEILRVRSMYEEEIQQLQSQLAKQYNLIGAMRQQLEDLSYLVNEQMLQKSSSNTNSLSNTLKTYELPLQLPNSMFQSSNTSAQGSLEIIMEEETERTIISSVRSPKNDHFIRIQQQQAEGYGKAFQYDMKPIKNFGYEDSLDINQSSHQKNLTVDEIILDCDICISEAFEDQIQDHNVLTSIDKRYQNEYLLIPESNSNNTPYDELSSLQSDFLADITNFHKNYPRINTGAKILEQSNIQVTPSEPSSYRQPKTKQFLEQFRKTFNKCLSSMNLSKKHSAKTSERVIKIEGGNKNGQRNYNLETKGQNRNGKSGQSGGTMQVTFGKGKKMSEKSRAYLQKQKDHLINSNHLQNKQYYSKAVHAMLKERDSGTQFLVGDKKIQLKYQGQKKNQIRQGNGIVFYSNGLCFEGQFRGGLRCGYGILKFNQIEIYNGDWKDDQICGQGKIRNCTIINKRKSSQRECPLSKWISYCGQFKNNRFEGQGTLYLQGGEKFLGKFIGGVACGQGTLYKQRYYYARKSGQVECGLWKSNVLVHKF